jgi:hypothetical protein
LRTGKEGNRERGKEAGPGNEGADEDVASEGGAAVDYNSGGGDAEVSIRYTHPRKLAETRSRSWRLTNGVKLEQAWRLTK